MIPDELLKQIGKMDADTIEKLTDAVFERKKGIVSTMGYCIFGYAQK